MSRVIRALQDMKSCLPGDHRTLSPSMRQRHADHPVVTEVNQILLPEEADYLVHRAREKGMKRSTVQGHVESKDRTSSTAHLEKGQDEVVKCIENRIATVAQQPVSTLEPLQVTAYKHTQKYNPHHDYFEPKHAGKSKSGQRTTSVFAYLTSVDEACGGATAFPLLKDARGHSLRVQPKKGNAVMWSNRKADGGTEERTLHSGEELTCGHTEKLGVNAWFRERPWTA